MSVAFEDLKEEDNVRLADVLRTLIDDELLVPLAIVIARDAHVMEGGADGQYEVHFPAWVHITLRVEQSD